MNCSKAIIKDELLVILRGNSDTLLLYHFGSLKYFRAEYIGHIGRKFLLQNVLEVFGVLPESSLHMGKIFRFCIRLFQVFSYAKYKPKTNVMLFRHLSAEIRHLLCPPSEVWRDTTTECCLDLDLCRRSPTCPCGRCVFRAFNKL